MRAVQDLRELPTPSPEAIARAYAPQLEAAEALLGVIWRDRPSNLPPFEEDDYRIVLIQILGRAIATYRGILLLCQSGMPTQAMMLARALYEDVLASYWAVLPKNRQTVVAQVLKQSHLDDELVAMAACDLSGRPYEPMLEEAEVAQLMAEFSGGSKSWFGKVPTARKEIEPEWVRRGHPATTLDSFHRIFYKEANLRLHNTATSISSGAERSPDRVFPTYGQLADVREHEMGLVMTTSGWLLSAVAEVVFDEFQIDTGDLTESWDRVVRAHKLLPTERARGIGRNDPCWCGSGLKLKRCHG